MKKIKKELKKPSGLKYDGGKAPLNLISNYALEELAKVLGFGATKYHPWNWAEGIAYSRVISAAKRHIAAWENGINTDHESNTNHLANAMCNLMFLLDYQAREMHHLDDRRPKHTLKKGKK
jgi:hypothetical protein